MVFSNSFIVEHGIELMVLSSTWYEHMASFLAHGFVYMVLEVFLYIRREHPSLSLVGNKGNKLLLFVCKVFVLLSNVLRLYKRDIRLVSFIEVRVITKRDDANKV